MTLADAATVLEVIQHLLDILSDYVRMTLADTATVGLWRVEADGGTVSLNAAMERLLDLPPHAPARGRSCWQHFDRATAERLQGVVRGPSLFPIDHLHTELIGAGGARRCVTLSAVPVIGDDGAVRHLQLTVVEMGDRETGRVRSEDEALVRAIAAISPAAVAVWTDRGIQYANPMLAHLTGYTGEELRQLAPLALVHADSRAEAEARFAEVSSGAADRARADLALVTKTGQIRWVDMTIGRIEYDRRPALAASALDITDRKRAELELRESEARYRGFFEDDLSGVLVASPDGGIVQCNPALARMLGFATIEELEGRSIREFYAQPARRDELIEIVRANRRAPRHEEELRRVDGAPLHVIADVVGSFDDTGALVATRSYLFDVTEIKRREEQSRTAQKVEAVVRLAGGIAHDFNNLLTVVTGHSERLVDELPTGSPLRLSAQAIHEVADRAASLTRQLLAFSRRQVFDLRVLDVNRLVNDVDPLLRQMLGDRIQLRLDLANGIPPVKADLAQLEHVLVNLALNARDAMTSGGMLTIRTRAIDIDAPPRERAWIASGLYVRIEVIDTGSGMDASTAAHVFEPFFTTKQLGRGSGLGLATTYGIVKQTNGYIWVDTTVGRGTAFTILLPAAAAAAEGRAPQRTWPPSGAETVLIVEDDENVRSLITDALKRRGYRVLDADSGERAEQIFAVHSGRIDLLLSDVVLGAMSGTELAARLRRVDPRLRVLYVSGYTGDSSPALGPSTPFLQKPFTLQALTEKVREVLDA